MITIVPEGGLCNRMRVAASAVLLARMANTSLRVKWYRRPDFNCRFEELFAPKSFPAEVVELQAMNRVSRIGIRLVEGALACAGGAVYGERRTEPGRFDLDAVLAGASTQDVYIRTNSRLVQTDGMYDCFVPTGESAEIIEQYSGQLATAVGVHIRRTDNKQAIQGSPLERFIELMRVEIDANPQTRFFVATDSPDSMHILRHEFGERVFEYPKRAYSRKDPIAIRDALVDLYCLGKTRKLIGSYWSSFTDTAAELCNIECVIAKG